MIDTNNLGWNRWKSYGRMYTCICTSVGTATIVGTATVGRYTPRSSMLVLFMSICASFWSPAARSNVCSPLYMCELSALCYAHLCMCKLSALLCMLVPIMPTHARAGSPAACVDVFQIFVHVRALSSPACSYLSRWHSRAGSPAACQRKFQMMYACASYQPCYTCSFVFTPALRRLQSRGVRACSTYIRCYMFITRIIHVRNFHGNFSMWNTLWTAAYSMHKRIATSNASRYMWAQQQTHTRICCTHMHCTDKTPTLILQSWADYLHTLLSNGTGSFSKISYDMSCGYLWKMRGFKEKTLHVRC